MYAFSRDNFLFFVSLRGRLVDDLGHFYETLRKTADLTI